MKKVYLFRFQNWIDSGIFNSDEVEVIGHMDGTIAIRIATLCELCGRGSRLYELNMGPVNRKICAEDYFKLTGYILKI